MMKYRLKDSCGRWLEGMFRNADAQHTPTRMGVWPHHWLGSRLLCLLGVMCVGGALVARVPGEEANNVRLVILLTDIGHNPNPGTPLPTPIFKYPCKNKYKCSHVFPVETGSTLFTPPSGAKYSVATLLVGDETNRVPVPNADWDLRWKMGRTYNGCAGKVTDNTNQRAWYIRTTFRHDMVVYHLKNCPATKVWLQIEWTPGPVQFIPMD